jgi:hypothetical protein
MRLLKEVRKAQSENEGKVDVELIESINKKMVLLFDYLHTVYKRDKREYSPSDLISVANDAIKVYKDKDFSLAGLLEHLLSDINYCSDRWVYSRVLRCEWAWQNILATAKGWCCSVEAINEHYERAVKELREFLINKQGELFCDRTFETGGEYAIEYFHILKEESEESDRTGDLTIRYWQQIANFSYVFNKAWKKAEKAV